MTICFQVARDWESAFPEAWEREAVRRLVARLTPSQPWDELMRARSMEVRGGINLWSDFGGYFETVFASHGAEGRYDALAVLPNAFERPGGRCEFARLVDPSGGTRILYLLDGPAILRTWPGRTDESYAHRCRAYATCFDAWMLALAGKNVEDELRAFEAREDAFETVTSAIELALIRAIEHAVATKCPVTMQW